MHDKQRSVLILGAHGRLGRELVVAFAAAGWRVLAQVRRPAARAGQAVAGGDGTIEIIEAALAADGAGCDACVKRMVAQATGADTVLYAINPHYADWHRQALPLLHAGMEIAQRLGARFMFPANVYNYGAAMPAELLPATPQRPSTDKGRLRCAMESAIATRSGQGLCCTVLRAGDFFGGDGGSWFDQAIVKPLRKGRLVYPGPDHLTHAWAYLPDLAALFVALAAAPQAQPLARYHFAGHAVTGAELLASTERAAIRLGLVPAGALRRQRLPWWLIRGVGVAYRPWRDLARMAYLWHVPHRLVDPALTAALPQAQGTALGAALEASLRRLYPAPPGAAVLADAAHAGLEDSA